MSFGCHSSCIIIDKLQKEISMRRKFFYFIVFLITLFIGIIFGIAFQRYKLFPNAYIKESYQYITQDKSIIPWSIGIYEGATPFNLTSPKEIINPVLTAKDVTDINARFVADPFIVVNNGKFFLFFEVMNRQTNQGDIGYAESDDGKTWKYKQIIIDEPFHLSYPYVFEWNNEYYLIPESHQDFSVRLYKATSFPSKWVYMGNLLSGFQCVDPSIFRYKDKWWLFVATGANNVLNLFYSDKLLRGWQPHPLNPIIKLNKHIARPGGRVILYNGKPYRFTQDCEPSYGLQVFAFEITELSEARYHEKIVSETPVVTKTGNRWNSAGMHQVDVIKVGNRWIAAVDGYGGKSAYAGK